MTKPGQKDGPKGVKIKIIGAAERMVSALWALGPFLVAKLHRTGHKVADLDEFVVRKSEVEAQQRQKKSGCATVGLGIKGQGLIGKVNRFGKDQISEVSPKSRDQTMNSLLPLLVVAVAMVLLVTVPNGLVAAEDGPDAAAKPDTEGAG